MVGALAGFEQVDEPTDEVPQSRDGAPAGFAQQRLELGEGVLDRIEVGVVERDELNRPGFAGGPNS